MVHPAIANAIRLNPSPPECNIIKDGPRHLVYDSIISNPDHRFCTSPSLPRSLNRPAVSYILCARYFPNQYRHHI